MWFNQSLAIDTNQNYVTCCSLPKNHKNYSFGNVKELSKSEVNKLKVSQDVCKECNKAGITFWMNNILGYDDFYINGVFLK
jgi:thymidine kinase